MTFYSDMAEVAVELLTEFGQSITLTRTTGGGIDPVTGAITPGIDDSKVTTGVITSYDKELVDGTLILSTDKRVVLSADVQPLITDTINGMRIINIDEKNPAGTVLEYIVQVRS